MASLALLKPTTLPGRGQANINLRLSIWTNCRARQLPPHSVHQPSGRCGLCSEYVPLGWRRLIPPPDPHPPRAPTHAESATRPPKGPRVRRHSKTTQPVPGAGGRQLPGGRSPPARRARPDCAFFACLKIIRRAEISSQCFQLLSLWIMSLDFRTPGNTFPGYVPNIGNILPIS